MQNHPVRENSTYCLPVYQAPSKWEVLTEGHCSESSIPSLDEEDNHSSMDLDEDLMSKVEVSLEELGKTELISDCLPASRIGDW
jgi:hypothetical protein